MPHTINYLNNAANQLRDLIANLHTPIFQTVEDDEVCDECGGTGEVLTDEDDGEGHLMRGVGTAKCICQY